MVSQGEGKKIIESGPGEVEAAFERWTNGANLHKEPRDRFGSYIEMLKNKSVGGGQAAFLLGYFNQRVAAYCPVEADRLNFFRDSLANYQSFLESGKKATSMRPILHVGRSEYFSNPWD